MHSALSKIALSSALARGHAEQSPKESRLTSFGDADLQIVQVNF